MDEFLDKMSDVIHIRIKKKIDEDSLQELFHQHNIKRYIISNEGDHLHVLVQTLKGVWFDKSEGSKTLIARVLKEKYGLKGNKDYSVALAREPNQLKKYVLKDGNYKFKGFKEDVINLFRLCSNKKGKDKLAKELQQLEEDYFQGEMSTEELYEKFIALKLSYGQNIYWNHTDAYIQKLQMKRSPQIIKERVRRRMSKWDD